MKTKLHLICNAHLDPVWLWKKAEGVAEALSTFRVAADFCEEYEGFVFNHNESFLYELVEEYEPELFERIKKLVAEGKWRIMGGWYLQPDCTMISGEDFVRQIQTGNKYFKQKFGIKPTTAINFDPFGHTRGLVQILKKSGYDSYVFMRPRDSMPEPDFVWRGYDGSEVIGHNLRGGYGNVKGDAVPKLEAQRENLKENGVNMLFWGVGNHGGGPSRIDVEGIAKYAKENPDLEIVHSWCEKYFEELDKIKLKTYDKSLVHCMIGCYTSMSKIKRLHRRTEAMLDLCEKMLAASGAKFDKKKLEEAEKAMLFSEFHDSLPGTMIKEAEQDVVRLLYHGGEIMSQGCEKAFYEICKGQKKAKPGEVPIVVFNPNPYVVEQDIEAEFQLENQNWTDNEYTLARVRDENGGYLPVQNEKESCSMSLDWRKRVVFRAKLEPMSINRFDCELYRINEPKRPIKMCKQTDNHFVFENERRTVWISKSTGLIDKFEVGGIDYLKQGSVGISAYKDYEDPWAMYSDGFYEEKGSFKLLSAKETNEFNGYPNEELESVRVIEGGEVRTKVQAIFKHQNTFAVVTYTVSEFDTCVDVHIKLLANDVNTMYKLNFFTNLTNSRFVGQTAFGKEEMLKENKEVVYQKWCGLFENEKGFAVINNATYGASCDGDNIKISLLRTPVYSAQPIRERPLTEHDRFNEHIDMGENEFDFRLTAECDFVDAESEMFNSKPYVLSFFPSGEGKKANTRFEITNKHIILSRYTKTEEDKILARLFNSSKNAEQTKVKTATGEFNLDFAPFELKTFVIEDNKMYETDMSGDIKL